MNFGSRGKQAKGQVKKGGGWRRDDRRLRRSMERERETFVFRKLKERKDERRADMQCVKMLSFNCVSQRYLNC